MDKTELITVRELVECIGQKMAEENAFPASEHELQDAEAEDIWEHGIEKKWLEPQDVSCKNDLIERRQAARILHEFLKKEMQEPDLREWEAAKCLLDLYDCRACVNHVAQVYSRGIMKGITDHIFGMREGVLRDELHPMVAQLWKVPK